MKLSPIDGAIIVGYILFALGFGVYYSKRAGRNIKEFFVSGRNLPWWLAGTSMVATTFAVDTPLVVTALVVNGGIAENWLWWNATLSGMLTTFLFSRLWRRAEIITAVELTELRYSGGSASFLRWFRALYIALPVNCITMGWVILAMQKIIMLTFNLPDTASWKVLAVLACMLIAGIYCVLSGFWGVVITDLVQFSMAMIGSITLAIIAMVKIGGIGTLKTKLVEVHGADHTILNFLPDLGAGEMAILTFGVYLGVQWWASNGDGSGYGGYITQRMFAAKDERNTLLATLWFNIAHYTLRPWPWILVALVSMVVYPNLADPEVGYPMLMLEYLPVGLLGLMMTAFLAAFMSTIDTHLNWGASYLVNDFYKRFFRPDADDHHYVIVSRISVVLIMVIAGATSLFMNSIANAWRFLIALNAGVGLVHILRWYWWRINAWSEISAMVASAVVTLIVFILPQTKDNFAYQMLIIVPVSTLVWLIATMVTAPVREERLIAFYNRVRPSGGWWKPIASRTNVKPDSGSSTPALINWLLGSVFVYCTLFAFGKLILGFYGPGLIFLLLALVTGGLVYRGIAELN
jgi:Na+/proline symporter